MIDDRERAAPWQRRIERAFEAWGRFVIRHRVAFVVISLLLTAGLLSQLPKLTVDNSPEAMLLDDDPAVLAYDAFRAQFGREDRLLVLIQTPDPFAPAFVERLRRLHEAIESTLPYVEQVDSLVNARVVTGHEGELEVGELFDPWPANHAEFARARARALANPLYRDRLLCADGGCTALSIKPWTFSDQGGGESALDGFDDDSASAAEGGTLSASASEAGGGGSRSRPEFLGSTQNDALVRGLLDLLEGFRAPDFVPFVAGEPAMTYRINSGMQSDLSIFMPATLVAIALLLAFIFRRVVAVVLPLMVVVLSLAATLGLMIVLGIPGSTAVQILPVFLLTVGVCDAVHILAIAYQRRQEGASKEDAIAFAIGHTGLAVFMTSATTAAGMASFLTAEMGAVRDLGLIAPIGVGLAYVYTMVTLPALLALWPMHARKNVAADPAERPVDRFLIGAGRFAARRPGWVLWPTALLTLLAAWGASRVAFSHNPLDWFGEGDWAGVAAKVVDGRLGGSVSLDLVFETNDAGTLYEPETLHAIEGFMQRVATLREGPVQVGPSMSILDIVKEAHEALSEGRTEARRIPETRQAVAQELLLFESSGSDDTEELVDSEYRTTRVNFRMPFEDALAFPPYLRKLADLADAGLPDGLSLRVTGVITLLSQVFEAVIRSMARSYVAALVLITPLMMLLLGSFRRGLVAMIPNVLPILAILGVMGWLGIKLDATTMMIGAMVIGIAVDDTIHFMHKFHRHFDETADLEYSVCETLRTTGSAMLFTSVALTLGFAVMACSNMLNLRIFGAFSAFATVVAFAADLWVGPALLAAIESTRRRRAKAAVLRTPATDAAGRVGGTG